MVDFGKLAGIVWMDAARKSDMTASSLSGEIIQNTFSVTSTQVAPANNNVFSDRARHIAVASEFRAQEQLMMKDARVAPLEIKTSENIKTNIFASLGRNMLTPLVIVGFNVQRTVASDKRFVEPEVAVVTSGNVVPFKRPILSLAVR